MKSIMKLNLLVIALTVLTGCSETPYAPTPVTTQGNQNTYNPNLNPTNLNVPVNPNMPYSPQQNPCGQVQQNPCVQAQQNPCGQFQQNPCAPRINPCYTQPTSYVRYNPYFNFNANVVARSNNCSLVKVNSCKKFRKRLRRKFVYVSSCGADVSNTYTAHNGYEEVVATTPRTNNTPCVNCSAEEIAANDAGNNTNNSNDSNTSPLPISSDNSVHLGAVMKGEDARALYDRLQYEPKKDSAGNKIKFGKSIQCTEARGIIHRDEDYECSFGIEPVTGAAYGIFEGKDAVVNSKYADSFKPYTAKRIDPHTTLSIGTDGLTAPNGLFVVKGSVAEKFFSMLDPSKDSVTATSNGHKITVRKGTNIKCFYKDEFLGAGYECEVTLDAASGLIGLPREDAKTEVVVPTDKPVVVPTDKQDDIQQILTDSNGVAIQPRDDINLYKNEIEKFEKDLPAYKKFTEEKTYQDRVKSQPTFGDKREITEAEEKANAASTIQQNQ